MWKYGKESYVALAPSTRPYLLYFWLVRLLEEGKLDNFKVNDTLCLIQFTGLVLQEKRTTLLKLSGTAFFFGRFLASFGNYFCEQTNSSLEIWIHDNHRDHKCLFFTSSLIYLQPQKEKSPRKESKDTCSKKFGKSSKKNIDWKTFASKLLRGCYFIHTAVFEAVFSSTRQSLSLNDANYVCVFTTF